MRYITSNDLDLEREFFNKRIEEIDNVMKKLPRGRIAKWKNGNNYTLCISKIDGSTGRKATKPLSKKKDRELIKSLANKEYLGKLKEFYSAEKQCIEIALECEQSSKEIKEEFYSEDSPYHKFMGIANKESKYESKVIEWINEKYEKSENYPEGLKFKTRSGLMVRSKSEMEIANELDYYGIPFRYECKTIIGDIVFYPDFTLLNKSTLEIVIWEHFGMLDDPAYIDGVTSKLNCFFKNGFVPGRNLIITEETREYPLDSARISRVIEEASLL